ncbi:MAG: WG repeat-containing protein, partial [Cytophagia bacterium]|nr:WG repeat-containing protein [Cytophagia bacterium]
MRFFKQLFFVLITLNCSILFADQFEPFSENGKVGLKNTTTNTVIIPASFEAMGWSDKSFSIVNGVTGALQNEKWALIDIEGHKVTDHYFNSLIPSFQKNFIASRRENNTILTHYGLIDSKGKTIIEFEYGLISPHARGLIVSKKQDGKYLRGFVSEKGQVIIPTQYQQVVSLNDNHL